jgi:flagellar basal-body rod protein FlgC
MSLGASLRISASGMAAQKLRLDVVAANLANVDTPGYRRKQVEFAEALSGAVLKLPFASGNSARIAGVTATGITEDMSPLRIIAETGQQSSNVEVVTEMVEMMAAVRSYEANVSAFNAARDMISKALQIGKAS